MAISTYLSIITLNVNGLNVLSKRHRVADWLKKKKTGPIYMQPIGDSLQSYKCTDWKWGDGKIYFIQMEMTRNWRQQYTYQTQ